MKKIIFATLLAMSSVSFAESKAAYYGMYLSDGDRHIPPSQVPNPVIIKFNTKFPAAHNVSWEVNSEDGVKRYEAKFTKGNGTRWSAEFLANGTFLEAHPL